MAIVKCQRGHFFDSSKYDNCPHCTNGDELQPDQKTVSASTLINEPFNKTISESMFQDDEKTVGFYARKIKADPVVGWLVCTDGPEAGRDYRIHAGRNYVGRGFKMDISIVDDQRVSRENHCSIVFDPTTNKFLLVPGLGTATYLNQSLISDPESIKSEDVVKVGDSELVLIQFCGGGRKWDIIG